MKPFITFLFLILSWTAISQQTISDSQEDFIENFIQAIESEGEFDFINLFDELSYLYEHPLDINNADYDDFKRLYVLNDIQINDIIGHRERFGNYLEIYELQSIPSISLEELKNLQAFISVNNENTPPQSIARMLKSANQEVFLKWRRVIETSRGYTEETSENSRFLGDPNRLFVRYNMRYENKLRLGVNMEKDEGEPFLNEVKKDFDFYSMHFHLRDYTAKLKDVAIGDYSISMGQGLILHNGFGAGKSSYVMDVKKGGRVIKSYNSINEVNFYRGIATTYSLLENVDVTAFLSRKDIDANQSSEPNDDGFDFFTSIINNGLHRSINDHNKINTVNEQVIGGQISFREANFKLNYNLLYSQFDKKFERRSSLYNQFLFAGESLLNQSIDYSFKIKNLNFFGESAFSDNGAGAHIAGVLVGLDRIADLSIIYRDYSPEYQTLFSNSFGESRLTNNEKGIYIGTIIRATPRLSISAYADHWQNPWLRFRVDSPSRGREYLVKLNYFIRRQANFYIQYKYENKGRNSTDPDLRIDQVIPIQTERLRAHLSYTIKKGLDIRSRIELSRYMEESQNDIGLLVYQDIMYKPTDSKMSMSGRLAYFDTPGFDSRIYTYETDLRYEYFIPFFADQGLRYYANFRYDLNYNTSLEVRAAQTRFFDRDVISSGVNEIEGNTKTQVKAQMRIRF